MLMEILKFFLFGNGCWNHETPLLPIVLIFLLALPFTGCQKHYPVADKLSQAEIYMNEEPEAALRVLESIGQPDLHTKEHHARYA